MIAAVLFDLDETLLARTESLRGFLADQHERFAGRLGDVARDVWRDRFLALDGRGRIHKAVVYPALLSEFGGDPTAADALLADYRARCCRFARPMPGAGEALAALRALGLRLGIVTNGETVFQTRHVEALGFGPLVDAVLISETEGLRKPDRALFLRAAARLGVAPAHCLFVGDHPVADVLGAHAAGMRAVWLAGDAPWPADLPPPPDAVVRSLWQVLGCVPAPGSPRGE